MNTLNNVTTIDFETEINHKILKYLISRLQTAIDENQAVFFEEKEERLDIVIEDREDREDEDVENQSESSEEFTQLKSQIEQMNKNFASLQDMIVREIRSINSRLNEIERKNNFPAWFPQPQPLVPTPMTPYTPGYPIKPDYTLSTNPVYGYTDVNKTKE